MSRAITPIQPPRTITSNFTSIAEVKQAMLAKLKDSGLTAKDAERLGFEPLTAQQVHAKLGRDLTFHRAGFQIPYFTMQGKKNCFYRFRYLEYDNGKGFSRLTHANSNAKPLKNDVRYVQPRDTAPQIYLPPMVPWTKIAKAVDIPLIITEGELKAACACKHDIATLGLGGVWSFKSTNAGLHLLPTLQEFQWQERPVYICFDSDASSNPNVCAAENALAHEFTKLGAEVYICRLPSLDGKKTGLDDFLTKQGKQVFEEKVRKPATLYTACEELFKLNSEVVYVRHPGCIVELETYERMTPRAFVEHAYSDRIWYETVQGGKQQKLVERCAPKEWLKWPHRAQVQRMQFIPGRPQYVDGVMNLWQGWGCQPWPDPVTEKDIMPWVEFRDRLLGGLTTEHVAWAIGWMAYHVQHPDVKQRQSILIWSRVQGNGKNWFAETLFPIYNSPVAVRRGQHYAETLNEETIIRDTRNTWAEAKLLVVVDDLTYRAQESYERLKPIITRTTVSVDPKYIPPFTINDFCSLWVTTNRSDSLRLDDTDRRLFIHEATNPPMTAEQQDSYKHFLEQEHGYRKLFRYLLDYDCAAAGYNPESYAPQTTAKLRLLSESASNVVGWARRLRDDPDSTLRIGKCALPYSLWRGSELLRLYHTDYPDSREPDSNVYQALRAAGFRRVLETDENRHKKDSGRVRVGPQQ